MRNDELLVRQLHTARRRIAILNIVLGEIIFKGAWIGLLGLSFSPFLRSSLPGSWWGEHPNILARRSNRGEVKLAILRFCYWPDASWASVLCPLSLELGLAGRFNMGPRLPEILYATASAAGNNGSAFAGLNANAPYYHTTLGLAMLFGGFLFIVLVMAVLGIACDGRVPASSDVPDDGGPVRQACSWA